MQFTASATSFRVFFYYFFIVLFVFFLKSNRVCKYVHISKQFCANCAVIFKSEWDAYICVRVSMHLISVCVQRGMYDLLSLLPFNENGKLRILILACNIK